MNRNYYKMSLLYKVLHNFVLTTFQPFVMSRFVYVFMVCLSVTGTVAQLPVSDLYLAQLSMDEGIISINRISYLSAFNNGGYNNQGYYFDDDELYITSAFKNDSFTDILALNPERGTFYKVTDTERISEFSPKLIPETQDFSTVRIEKDGKDQSLWRYPLSRENYGYRLFPNLKNVGYYCWLDASRVAMFLVGKPHKLVIGDIGTSTVQHIVSNPGRCFVSDKKDLLYFVEKISPDLWILKSFNIRTKDTYSITKMPKDVEDFDILKDGSFICPTKSTLRIFNPDSDLKWRIVADLSYLGINNINRTVLKGNQLIFVNIK